MRALETVVALALAACAGACASAEARPAASTQGADAGAAADARTPPEARCDQGRGFALPARLAAFEHVSATVVDLDGAPVAGVAAQACGINVCLNGTTDASGGVVIEERASVNRPAFKYGGGQRYARFALPFAATDRIDVDLGEQRTVAFDPPEEGAELAPGTSATSRGVTLTLQAATSVKVDPFDYATPLLERLRAAEIPVTQAPAAVDRALGFELIVALTPAGATLCPPARMSAPNTPHFPAGSAVEFFVHGVEVTEEFAPYGGWAKVSDGTVSPDGAHVVTDPAGGIPLLSVIGVRLAR